VTEDGKLFAWGSNANCKSGFQDPNQENSQPKEVSYFSENNLEVVEASGGLDHSIILAKSRADGSEKLFTLGNTEGNYNYLGITQLEAADQTKFVHELTVFAKSRVQSFFAGSQYSCVLLKGEQMPIENVSEHIIPESGIQKGFLHFYKQADKWHYVSQSEFEQKKHELPAVCFAMKYPIADLESKPFPNLDELLNQLDTEAQPDENGLYTHKNIHNNNIKNKKDKDIVGPRYIAPTIINGGDFVINTHEAGFKRMQTWDIHPLIFYRLTKPLKEGERLPTLDLKKFYRETNYSGYSIKVKKSLQFEENEELITAL